MTMLPESMGVIMLVLMVVVLRVVVIVRVARHISARLLAGRHCIARSGAGVGA